MTDPADRTPPFPLGLTDEEFAGVRGFLYEDVPGERTQTHADARMRLLAEIVGLLRQIDDKLQVLLDGRRTPR